MILSICKKNVKNPYEMVRPMIEQKYYDYSNQKPIDLEMDGCSFDEWQRGTSSCHFAKHPKGFLVFLPPSEVGNHDEYSVQDPYEVAENLQSDFHQRRLNCTLEFVAEAISGNEGKRILDLGCGRGHFTSCLKLKHPKLDVSGLDYSVSAISYAVDHFKGIDFI